MALFLPLPPPSARDSTMLRGGWLRGAGGGGREGVEEQPVPGCRGSGRYLVNDYSLARRRLAGLEYKIVFEMLRVLLLPLPSLLTLDPGAGPGRFCWLAISLQHGGRENSSRAARRYCTRVLARLQAVSATYCTVSGETGIGNVTYAREETAMDAYAGRRGAGWGLGSRWRRGVCYVQGD